MTQTTQHNSSIEYVQLKEQAIKNQPMLVEMPLSDISLDRNSTIRIKNQLVPTTERAYDYFLKNILDIDPKFVTKFKKATDEKTELSMLSVLKSGLAAKKKEVVKVVANPNTKLISSFLNRKDKFLTNENLLNLFEIIMNRYPSLGFQDFKVNKSNGNIALTVRHNNVVDLANGENFLGGLTFVNNAITGTSLLHNALRLICTNGAMGFKAEKIPMGTTNKYLEPLFNALDKLKEREFLAEEFSSYYKANTNALSSVYELMFARKTLLDESNIGEERINEILPIEQTRSYLSSKGVAMDFLNSAQKHNCPTQVNRWDLFNIMTDFGSHDYGYEKDDLRIQAKAGILLKTKPDAEGFIFFNN